MCSIQHWWRFSLWRVPAQHYHLKLSFAATPTKKLARVKLLVNWNHHASCFPTRLLLPPVFTASSHFHVLLACLLVPPGQRLPRGVGAETERVGRAPAAPLPAPIARGCRSPPPLHRSTCKTPSIATFQERLYEKPDAEVLLDISKKTHNWGMVTVSFNLMLNSTVIRVGRISPPKTCWPQTAMCRQNLQKAYERRPEETAVGKREAAHIGMAWGNQKAVRLYCLKGWSIHGYKAYSMSLPSKASRNLSL